MKIRKQPAQRVALAGLAFGVALYVIGNWFSEGTTDTMAQLFQAVFILACFVAAVWFLFFWRGPKKEKFRPTTPSTFLRGYEIPNPRASVFVIHGMIAIVPAVAFVAAHRPLAAVIAFVVGAGLFHVRNFAVRVENARGLHDPLWGPHLRRQSQAAADRALPRGLKWLPKMRELLFPD